MFRLHNRIGHNLNRTEGLEVDNRHTRIGFIIDKEVLAVVFTIGFGKCRMMGISPGYFPASNAALVEDFHTFNITIAISLPGFRTENRNIFQQSHGRHAISNHLSGLPPGRKDIILIQFPGRGVSFGCGQHVLLGEPPCLHDLLQLGDCAFTVAHNPKTIMPIRAG